MDGIKNNPNARKKRNGDNSHLSKGDEGIESSADDPTLLWKEVGESLLLSKKVSSKDIIKSLETAAAIRFNQQDPYEDNMLDFVNGHFTSIINAVLDKDYDIIEKIAKKQVEKILKLALEMISKWYIDHNSIHHLASIFDKKKAFYADDLSHSSLGCSGVRINQIKIFSKLKGFDQLSQCLDVDITLLKSIEEYFSSLPSLLESLFEAITITDEKENENVYKISNAIMKHISDLDEKILATLPTKQIHQVLNQLQRLNKRLTFSNYKYTKLLDYYSFCQSVVLKLIRLDSVEQKFFGLKVIEELIRSTHMPRSYTVSGAGSWRVNGAYELCSSSIEGGCITGRSIVVYKHTNSSKTLKIHPCLMTEAGETFLSTWWFISETKGTTDYYFHKSKLQEQDRPSPSGWTACGGVTDPPPTLEPHQTDLVPIGEERNTLEQQLSKWIVQNNVFDIVTKAQNSFMETPTAIVKFLSKLNGGKDCSGVRSVLDQKSRLLEPILPLLSEDIVSAHQSSYAASAQSPTSVAASTSSSGAFSAISAAKQRLASAERWRKSTESALQQYLLASNEVQNARQSLKQLEDAHQVINIDSDADSDDEEIDGDKKQSAKRQRR